MSTGHVPGPTNRWYSEAMANAQPFGLSAQLPIRVITAPYFIATKLDAFGDGRRGDYLSSHDLEDIIAIVDGRATVESEILSSPPGVRAFLIERFKTLMADPDFVDAIAGHLPGDSASQARLPLCCRECADRDRGLVLFERLDDLRHEVLPDLDQRLVNGPRHGGQVVAVRPLTSARMCSSAKSKRCTAEYVVTSFLESRGGAASVAAAAGGTATRRTRRLCGRSAVTRSSSAIASASGLGAAGSCVDDDGQPQHRGLGAGHEEDRAQRSEARAQVGERALHARARRDLGRAEAGGHGLERQLGVKAQQRRPPLRPRQQRQRAPHQPPALAHQQRGLRIGGRGGRLDVGASSARRCSTRWRSIAAFRPTRSIHAAGRSARPPLSSIAHASSCARSSAARGSRRAAIARASVQSFRFMLITSIPIDDRDGGSFRDLTGKCLSLEPAVSRVLFRCCHRWWSFLWAARCRTARATNSESGVGAGHAGQANLADGFAIPDRSCSRWGLPCPPRHRGGGALLPHRFTRARRLAAPGGLFSVALSFESPRLAVSQHPALRSPDFPRRPPEGNRRDHLSGSSEKRARLYRRTTRVTTPGRPHRL